MRYCSTVWVLILATDFEKRRSLLTFVVVGGGPTGVETAGALAELIRHVMTKDYPHMDLQEVRVLLLEAADHLMGSYPPELRETTFKLLASKHVEILLATKLADYDGRQVTLRDGGQIGAGIVRASRDCFERAAEAYHAKYG